MSVSSCTAVYGVAAATPGLCDHRVETRLNPTMLSTPKARAMLDMPEPLGVDLVADSFVVKLDVFSARDVRGNISAGAT